MNISSESLEKNETVPDWLKTAYVLAIWKDSAIDIYEVTNSTLEGIIEDITACGMENTLSITDKLVSILNNDVNTVYYYNIDDREKKLKELLDVH